jgi:ribonuclease HI
VLDEVWLYTDGAARANPGPAAAGGVLGDKTNNQGEYAALILGLEGG